MRRGLLLALASLAAASGCGDGGPNGVGETGSGEASSYTAAANEAVARSLPLTDAQDFEDARRGFIAADDPLIIPGPDGTPAWDLSSYDFLDGDTPPTVNPSLWRQAKLNAVRGLFEVTEGVYQVRGYDVSNMTLIEGRTGWIVVDPLTVEETAAAAIALARRHLGSRPVSAVIFTHSHVDHLGGIDGVLRPGAGEQANVPIIAPEGFMEDATSENVLAGVVMGRRALYMFGHALPRSPQGHVNTGLGIGVAMEGMISIREPTTLVDRTPQEMEVGGVRFVFQNTPASEAPAELTFYLPDRKAWCGAEIVSHTMHNLCTLRGAKVRDARNRLSRGATRHVPLHSRPDLAACQPGLHATGDRRAGGAAVEPAYPLCQSRLLRHGAAQFEGGLPGLFWLV